VDGYGDDGQNDRDKEGHVFGWCELKHCIVPLAKPVSERRDFSLYRFSSGLFLFRFPPHADR
jgi:hypothetical protein